MSVYYTADWPNLRLKPCLLQAQGKQNWSLPEGFNIQFEGEQAELFIGGVYVRLFLKTPQFPLRHPKVQIFLCSYN